MQCFTTHVFLPQGFVVVALGQIGGSAEIAAVLKLRLCVVLLVLLRLEISISRFNTHHSHIDNIIVTHFQTPPTGFKLETLHAILTGSQIIS